MKKFFIFALSNGVNAAYGDNDNLGLFDIKRLANGESEPNLFEIWPKY